MFLPWADTCLFFHAERYEKQGGGVILSSISRLCILTALSLVFVSCNDFPMQIAQHFSNKSDYDVTVIIQDNRFSIRSGETACIDAEIGGVGDSAPVAKLAADGYPRAVMKRKLVSLREAEYAITNMSGAACRIVNAGAYSVCVKNPYIGSRYDDVADGITLPSGGVFETVIYGNDRNFTGTYRNDTPADEVEKALQGTAVKSVTVSTVDGQIVVRVE